MNFSLLSLSLSKYVYIYIYMYVFSRQGPSDRAPRQASGRFERAPPAGRPAASQRRLPVSRRLVSLQYYQYYQQQYYYIFVLLLSLYQCDYYYEYQFTNYYFYTCQLLLLLTIIVMMYYRYAYLLTYQFCTPMLVISTANDIKGL